MTNKLCCVSIIIPAYNVEKYIIRAIDSCINQTYSNIEIIVIDDGSMDNTFDIAKAYSKQDYRINVYKQNNAGVSVARNRALEMSKGEYVIFLDADDWLEVDTIEKLFRYLPITEENVLVSADAYSVDIKDGNIHKKKVFNMTEVTELTSEETLKYVGKVQYKLQSACYKLFSMRIIREHALQFDANIKHGEDGLFVFEYLKCIDKFIYFSEPLWNILNRQGSATRSSYNKEWLSAISAVEKMLSYNNSPELDLELRNYKVQRTVMVLSHAIVNSISGYDDIMILRCSLRKECIRYIRTEKSVKKRLFFIFATFFPIKIVSYYCRKRGN